MGFIGGLIWGICGTLVLQDLMKPVLKKLEEKGEQQKRRARGVMYFKDL